MTECERTSSKSICQCSRQNNGPSEAHIPILSTREYVTFMAKKDFANATEVMDLRWGGYPGLSGGPSLTTCILKSENLSQLWNI